MTALLKKHGLTPVGDVGKTAPFHPDLHEHVGEPPAPGADVQVHRPGMSLHRGEGDHVTVSKAVVGSTPAKAAESANPLAGLEGLTPVQKRARLRKRGLSKEEIDQLVPLTVAQKRAPVTVADAQDIAEEFFVKKSSREQILERLDGMNIAELKKVAAASGVPAPRDYTKTEAGPVLATPKKLTADQWREYIANSITADRRRQNDPTVRDTGPDTPQTKRIRDRLAQIAGESGPLRDAVLADRESTRVKSHNENLALYGHQDRLNKLGEEGSRLANELLDAQIARDGEPFGGDVAAGHWRPPELGFGTLEDVGNLDPAERQRIRDRYVIKDKSTLANNASLRSEAPTPAAESWARSVSKLIRSSRLRRDTVLSRGAALTPDQIMQLRPGAVIRDGGFVSTAAGQVQEADFYARDRVQNHPGTIKTMFEIRAPKGSPAVDVGYGEIVLDRDGRFRVVSSRRDSDRTVHVVMELLA